MTYEIQCRTYGRNGNWKTVATRSIKDAAETYAWLASRQHKTKEYRVVAINDVGEDGIMTDTRSCTCHPDEAPTPCQRKYALRDCLTEKRDYLFYIEAKEEIGETPLTLDQWREFNKTAAR